MELEDLSSSPASTTGLGVPLCDVPVAPHRATVKMKGGNSRTQESEF